MTAAHTRRVAVLVLLVLSALVLLLLLAGRVDAGGALRPTETYTVVAGDTVWEIAAERTGPADDVRDMVRDIVRLNDLRGGLLRPGQQLVVPVGG